MKRPRLRRIFALPVAQDVEREVRFHLDQRAEELVAAGWSEADARREAERLFGNTESVRSEMREISERQARATRRARALDELRQDVRFAWRTLARSPAFTAVALVTLALGIGANTAIFSVIHGVLLRPLPYPDPDRLAFIAEANERTPEMPVATPNFRDWQAQAGSFEALALYGIFGGQSTVLGADVPSRAWARFVSPDFFRVFGLAAARGRTLGEGDAVSAVGPRVVVSHRYWRSALGADEGVLGRTLDIFGEPREIVGVMPEGFHYPDETDIWLTGSLDADQSTRTSHNWHVVARLRDGVSLAAAGAELNALQAAIAQREESHADRVLISSLEERLVGPVRSTLWLLLGAAGLVLLIACANLASALLARAGGRSGEMAVRAAMGAGRGRVLRQLLTESLLLALPGAGLALLLSGVLVRLLLGVHPGAVPRAESIGLNAPVLLFAAGLTLVTTVLFGLAPALRLARTDPGRELREGSRGTGDRARRRSFALLVAGEVALAIVLLVGAGLLLRSFAGILARDAGWNPEGVLTAEVSLAGEAYATPEGVVGFYRRVFDELAALPGVQAVGMVNNLPLGGAAINGTFSIEGRQPESGYAEYRLVGGGYFEAMGIPLLRGRTFDENDHPGAPHAVVVNQALAERYWPGEDPLGKRIVNPSNDSWAYRDVPLTVVGVVGNVRHHSLLADERPELYVHYAQRPARAGAVTLVLRTGGRAGSSIPLVRERLAAVDDDVPATFATMEERVARSLADRRFVLLLLGGFALVALLLTAVGIYGLVAHTVAQRTREIGIRLALGADAAAVLRLLMRDAALLGLAGAAFGVGGALWLDDVVRGLLVGVSTTDPATYLAVAALLAGTVVLASWIPARRAARVSPATSLRE